jgi:hypothetical protein
VALIVEDGTGRADAESYLSVSAFKTYADGRGLSYSGKTDPQVEQALRRGTAWLDGRYGPRFVGARLNGRAQALAWPRTGAYDDAGEEVAGDDLPAEVMNATAEAAHRELTAPGSLLPDVAATGGVKRKRVKAGTVETEAEYVVPLRPGVGVPVVDGILRPLLKSASFVGEAVRG